MGRILLFYLLISISLVSYAEKCPEIDLTKSTAKRKAILAKPTIRQTAGFCYAHSAADVITAATGEEASPLHVALHYNYMFDNGVKPVDSENAFPEGGFIDMALSSIQDLGWVAKHQCFQTKVKNDTRVLNFIYKFKRKKLDDYFITKQSQSRTCSSYIENRTFSKFFTDELLSVTNEDLLVTQIANTCFDDSIKLKGTRFCSVPSNSGHYKYVDKSGGFKVKIPKPKAIKKGILWALSNDSPVTFLFDTETFSSEKTDHATTITGLKKINGVCHAIVRNYWAEPCDESWPKKYPQIICKSKEVPSDSFAMPLEMVVQSASRISYATDGKNLKKKSNFYKRKMGGFSLYGPNCSE